MRKLTVFVVLVAVVLGGLTGYASAHGRDGYRRVTVDRGKLTAASATEVTVERRDGVIVTKAVNRHTKVRGAASADLLETGKRVVVVAKGDTATLIVQRVVTKKRGRGAYFSARVSFT